PRVILSRRDGEESPTRTAPELRGALSRDRKVILEFDDSPDVLSFLARDDAERITQIGAATPDHLLHTKRFPLFLGNDSVEKYVDRYKANYEKFHSEFAMLHPTP